VLAALWTWRREAANPLGPAAALAHIPQALPHGGNFARLPVVRAAARATAGRAENRRAFTAASALEDLTAPAFARLIFALSKLHDITLSDADNVAVFGVVRGAQADGAFARIARDGRLTRAKLLLTNERDLTGTRLRCAALERAKLPDDAEMLGVLRIAARALVAFGSFAGPSRFGAVDVEARERFTAGDKLLVQDHRHAGMRLGEVFAQMARTRPKVPAFGAGHGAPFAGLADARAVAADARLV
jgi:hypothetical protein